MFEPVTRIGFMRWTFTPGAAGGWFVGVDSSGALTAGVTVSLLSCAYAGLAPPTNSVATIMPLTATQELRTMFLIVTSLLSSPDGRTGFLVRYDSCSQSQ